MKHLFLALMRIVQCDVTMKDRAAVIKEIIRKIEKSPAGEEGIILAAKEWLGTVDSRNADEIDEITTASRLIDHAITTTTCRAELDVNLEKLKTLKSEHTAALKSLRQSFEERKQELGKERMRLPTYEEVDDWKKRSGEVEQEFKDETSRLTSEFWSENRRLSPRTGLLGCDCLGNRYWVFNSRKTKERDFGGWVVIQTPEGKAPNATKEDNNIKETTEDGYQSMRSWYYVEKIEDVKQLILWTNYLALKTAMDHDRKVRRVPKGSPNQLGQSFAVEIPVKKPQFQKSKIPEFTGLTETKVLGEELLHAVEWIEERYAAYHRD
jgi:hypothetical protein